MKKVLLIITLSLILVGTAGLYIADRVFDMIFASTLSDMKAGLTDLQPGSASEPLPSEGLAGSTEAVPEENTAKSPTTDPSGKVHRPAKPEAHSGISPAENPVQPASDGNSASKPPVQPKPDGQSQPAPAPAKPAVDTAKAIAAAEEKVSTADKARAIGIVASKLSGDDIARLKALAKSGINNATIAQAKAIISGKVSKEEKEELKRLFYKYSGLIQ